MTLTRVGERAAGLATPPPRRVWLPLGVGVALTIGVAVRLHSASALWLDETLSVNIARLPLSQLPQALREDGSPPLYYLLLHGWIAVFGDGTTAVRALSAVFGVAALPLIWLAGRRLADAATGWTAVLLLASMPFAAVGVTFFSHLSYGLLSDLPATSTSVQGTRSVREHFPAGATGPVTILLHNDQIDFSQRGDDDAASGLKLVHDLTVALGQRKKELRLADIRVEDNIEESEQGRFGWAYDVEGNKFELWEPPAA